MLAAALVLAGTEAQAQEPTTSSDQPFVALLTFTPGTHPFLLFGHTAFWVHDPRQAVREDRDVVYNYGTFEFDSPWVIPRFLVGKLWYWLAVNSLEETLHIYGAERRGLRAQVLRLSAQERDAMLSRLSNQALPANRAYRYDFFRDNCATRPRDQINLATGGRLLRAHQERAPLSFRQEARRMAQVNAPVMLGMDLLLGPAADVPVSTWDALFLPERLAQGVRRVIVSTPDGERPLVEREIVLLPGDSPRREAPSLWPFAALSGLGLGAFTLALAWGAARWRWARRALGLWIGAQGLFCGGAGVLVLWFWLVTDVAVVQRNANALLCAPVALALVGLAPRVFQGEHRALRRAAKIAASLVACSLGSEALRIFLGQGGHELALMVALLWSGTALALAWCGRHLGASVGAGADEEDDDAAGVPGGGGGIRSRPGGPP